MNVNPYLIFNGNCKSAFEFYAKNLNGTIVAMMTHGEAPMKDQTPPDWHDNIIHARVAIAGTVIMGSDAPPGRYDATKGFFVTLSMADPAEAKGLFEVLAEKGTVQMPLQETFWAQAFGMLVDRFGTPWMINCEKKS